MRDVYTTYLHERNLTEEDYPFDQYQAEHGEATEEHHDQSEEDAASEASVTPATTDLNNRPSTSNGAGSQSRGNTNGTTVFTNSWYQQSEQRDGT